MRGLSKHVGLAVALASVAGLMGCEWEGASDGTSWNSSYSWVNFSGVYKAPGNSVLVSDFSSQADTGFTVQPDGTVVPNVITVTNVVNAEGIGQGDGVATTFSGVLNRKPVVPGSVSITAGGFNLTDDGSGSLSGGGANGAIDYGTGAWSINLQGVPLANGQPITAAYSYTTTSGGGGGGGGGGGSGGGGVKPGSSGKTIYSFTVFQTGNKLEIVDNNGAKYTGRMGGVSTTTGGTPADVVQPSVGDSVVAEYTAEGVSAAGVSTMLVGTFQGVVGRGSGTAMFLTDRRMLGTWVESKGVTGDINGQAAPVAISITTTE